MKKSEHRPTKLAARLMKGATVCFIVLFLTGVPVEARRSASESVELTLHPAKVAEPAQTYRLLPSPGKQTDADAVPLYQKAIQSMPQETNRKQIQEWLARPLEQFPQQQAEQVIQEHLESLRLVARATRCKECNWPEWEPATDPPDTSAYRELTYVIRLWARLEICQGQYKGALVALQTALGLARHLSQIPSLDEVLVVTAIGRSVCQELEQFVQGPDSPNLHGALTNLPEPLIDVEKAIEREWGHLQASLTQKPSEKQLNAANEVYGRVRWIAKRIDNHVNALQVVEALRHYAATHDGQLPQALGDISDIEVPDDLVSGKAFLYRRTSAGAMLQSAIPEGGDERDTVHYKIVLKK